MLQHKHSDIGVAVALPFGLITPIVRNAEMKSLSVISNEMRDFAARARAKKLKPHEYQGGSIVGVQSRHVRHQGFHRGDQSAAVDASSPSVPARSARWCATARSKSPRS